MLVVLPARVVVEVDALTPRLLFVVLQVVFPALRRVEITVLGEWPLIEEVVLVVFPCRDVFVIRTDTPLLFMVVVYFVLPNFTVLVDFMETPRPLFVVV